MLNFITPTTATVNLLDATWVRAITHAGFYTSLNFETTDDAVTTPLQIRVATGYLLNRHCNVTMSN